MSPELRRPDVVLAADCVYYEPAFPLLEETLKELVGPDTLCLMAYKKRRRADKRFFTRIRKSFELIEIKDDPDYAAYLKEGVYLYRLKRRC